MGGPNLVKRSRDGSMFPRYPFDLGTGHEGGRVQTHRTLRQQPQEMGFEIHRGLLCQWAYRSPADILLEMFIIDLNAS